MCPYEEFERTKHDFGACPLIHDDDLKAQWEVSIYQPIWAVPALQTSYCKQQTLVLKPSFCHMQALDDRSRERLGFEKELYKCENLFQEVDAL
jgi:hypothetical protein